jgi:hypothetical protein
MPAVGDARRRAKVATANKAYTHQYGFDPKAMVSGLKHIHKFQLGGIERPLLLPYLALRAAFSDVGALLDLPVRPRDQPNRCPYQRPDTSWQ